MNPERATSWYRRMSVVYALGTWTLLGSTFYFVQKKKPPGNEVEQKDVSTSEIPESPKQFYVETIVTYKEDFVPYTTKILEYLKSWTGSSGSES
ncbi:small integral membrane protein 26 [Callospermophilus lateralis]|uniref:small integral membrane protein 26 n=1 Tax=Callospermophilus lateralis TaxID=76772 RepID=UPI0040387753